MSKKQKILDAPFTKHLSKSGETHGGHVYWVKLASAADFDVFYEEHFEQYDNGESSVHSTIASAVAACTANVGDVIYVTEGYTESITAAAGLALSTAGIAVIGLGVGDARPTITFASTDNAATMTMASDDVAFKNFVLVCNDDALTNALVVTGDNCDIDIEFQDTSATVEAATAVRLDTAHNCTLKLKYLGFTGGNAVVSAVRLDDCDNVRIEIDAYGINTTAWVEMVDSASTNVTVKGGVYTSGVTDFSQNVVDTVTGSTWWAVLDDRSAGSVVIGSNVSAFADADVSAITALIGTANATTTDSLHGKLGTDTEMADRSVYDLINGGGPAAAAAAAVPANDVSLYAVLRDAWDALRNGTGGAEPETNRSVVDYLGVSPGFFVPGLGYAVSKAGDLSGANDDLFDITGKVLITLIVGEVTTVLSGAESFQLRIKTDNIALCAATTIDTDADGTHYMISGDFGDTLNGGSTPGLRAADVNSAGARGSFVVGDAGGSAVIEHNTTGNNGIITWTLFYLPLEASAAVTASA